MQSTVKTIGTYALGIVGFIAVLAIPGILIGGGIWIGERILPWLVFISFLTLAFCVVILGPLALIPATRPWAGLGYFIASYVFGLTGWFMGLLLTWILWGGFAVFVGLLILGCGVVPIAMLATFFKGMWAEFGILVLAVVLTFGSRILGACLVDKE